MSALAADTLLARPAVRVRRAPPLDPPFDDERAQPAEDRAVAIPGAQMLPLRWPSQPSRGSRTTATVLVRPVFGATQPRPPGEPSRGEPPPGEPPGSPGHAGPQLPHHGGRAHHRTPGSPTSGAGRPGLTPGRLAAQRFVGACVEVLNGHRPVAHLRALAAPGELPRVTDQLVRRTTRTYLGRPGASAPRPHRVRVRTVHVCEPRDGVAELAAVLEYGGQTWAMAARLERRSDAWLCTVVQVI